jgi:hypothetical protein
MTSHRLNKLTRRLGRELGLVQEGWQLAAEFNADLESAAAVAWEPSRRCAFIEIRPLPALQNDIGPHDSMRRIPVTYTLVHELLHLRLEGHLSQEEAEDSPTRTPAFEWALDKVARSICKGLLRRGKVTPL